jgi:hypothetical protein
MNDIHTCHFGCHRPACALSQRDQLWEFVQKIYTTVNELEPGNRWTFDQAMAYAIDKLKEKK